LKCQIFWAEVQKFQQIKTLEYPFSPFDGDSSDEGLEKAKTEALEVLNNYLKPEMRFARALEDWGDVA
jgi:hypothetical protein